MRILIFIALLCVAAQGRGQIYINSYRFGAIVSDSLFLDFYSGANAAYSLRKLDKDYTGNCITVRRVNGDTSLIGFSGNYLDTVALKNFCGTTSTDSCWVRRWFDQSGNARNVEQTTSENQPRILTSGKIDMLNGLPAMQFDGSNDRLLSTTFAWGTAFTFIGIFSAIDNNNYGKLYSIGADATGSGYAFSTFAGASTMDWADNDALVFGKGYSAGANPRIVSQGAIFTNNVQNLIFLNLSSTTSNMYKNNVEITYRVQGTANTDNASNILYIGSANTNIQNFRGSAQELIFYTSNKNTDRTGMQTNINTFYTVY